MNKRELLRKYISDELFEDLSNFVEDLYLLDYEYLILMARKFYNLFCIFQELNYEKYKFLGIPYKNNVKVVSDRALPLLRHMLKTGKHKIAIGDDIIIHGRGIRALYDKLYNENPSLDIMIETFVINNDDTSIYDDISDRIHSYYEAPADKWRDISDRIVASFWLFGRPYISYLPYFVIDTDWEVLIHKLDQEKCIPVTNYDLKYYGIDLLVYYGKEFDAIQNLNCCNIAAVRFYNYKKLNRIIAIPYFCTNTLEESSLKSLSDIMRTNLFTSEYTALLNSNNGADDMRLMEFEYTMSLLLAKSLFDQAKIQIKEWSRDIEKSTFCELLINHASIDTIDIGKNLKDIITADTHIIPKPPVVPQNEEELFSAYSDLKDYYSQQYNHLKTQKNWIVETDLLQEYIEKILLLNGNIDEKRCKNSDHKEKTRVLGMPVTYLLADSSLFWANLNNSSDTDSYKRMLFSEIIAAIDSGKGSIVIKNVPNGKSEQIKESLLHAGEQNYKYYEATNYPFMYGLMLIEYRTKTGELYLQQDIIKQDFQKKYNAYLDHQGIKYNLEDQKMLLSMSMMNEYGRFLLNISDKYIGNEVLHIASMLARKVVTEKTNG